MTAEARFDPMVAALRRFGNAGRRVLDVGCGDGALVRRLNREGYRATGIDPKAAGVAHCSAVTLEAFQPTERFDVVTASVSLHHTANIAATAAHIRALLAPGGVAVVAEFGWEAMDLPTISWAQSALALEKYRGLDGPAALEHWFREHGDLHAGASMLRCFDVFFRREQVERVPYLAWMADRPDHVDDELARIASQEIVPIGFIFTGRA